MHGDDAHVGQRGVAVIRAALFMLALAACGSTPAILPPNTAQACTLAVGCGAFLYEQHETCVACLEHIDPKLKSEIDALPPLEQWTCEQVHAVVRGTNLRDCVTGQWYGPFAYMWGPR